MSPEHTIVQATMYDGNMLVYHNGHKVFFRVSAADEYWFDHEMDTNWHHIAFTVESDGTRHAYLDGDEQVIHSMGAFSIPYTTDELIIGNGYAPNKGALDELRILSQAVTEDYFKFEYDNISDPTQRLIFGTEESGWYFSASGGVLVAEDPFNKSRFSALYNIAIDFSWEVAAYITISQDFEWTTGDVPLKWYRVASSCDHNVACVTAGISSQDNCGTGSIGGEGLQGQQYFRMVAAASISDLCVKLKNEMLRSPFKWRVATIQEMSPAYASDRTGQNCETFVSRTWCEVPECFEFCLLSDEEVKIGAAASGGSVSRFVATGGIEIGGSANARVVWPSCHASGGVAVSGTASIKSSRWEHVAVTVPPILIDGNALFKSSHYHFAASGGVETTGTAATYVSTGWKFIASGGVSVLGNAVSRPTGRCQFVASGVGVLVTGSAPSEGRNYKYIFDSTGGLTVDGEAGSWANPRVHHATGSIVLSGHSPAVVPKYTFSASGQIELGGSCGVGLFFVPSGGVSVGGTAYSSIVKKYMSVGGVEVSGSANYTSSGFMFTASGGIDVTGEATTWSNYLGCFNVSFAGSADIDDLGIMTLSESDATGTLSVELPTNIVTDCGYEVATQMALTHNLATNNALGDFLVRARLTIPDKIILTYIESRQLWKWNAHYVYSGEVWDILIEFSCTDQITDMELGQMMWKFNTTIRRKVSGVTQVTRLGLVFKPDKITNVTMIDFNFTLDPVSGVVSNTAASTNLFFVYEDGIELFKNTYWQNKTLKFYISEGKTSAIAVQLVNLGDMTTGVGSQPVYSAAEAAEAAGTQAVLSDITLGSRTLVAPLNPSQNDVSTTINPTPNVPSKPSPYQQTSRELIKTPNKSKSTSSVPRIFPK